MKGAVFLKIFSLELGICGVCTYIIEGEKRECVIVDPGDEIEKIESALETNSLIPKGVFLTHGHFDHIGEVNSLREKYSCPLYVHGDEVERIANPALNMSNRFSSAPISILSPENVLADGDVIRAAGLEFQVMHTPGHSEGSVVYRCGDSLFTGDTLFDGCSGRWDFVGGDREKIKKSLDKIFEIKENLKVYPGHNNSTTLDKQRGIYKYFA